VRYLCVLVYVGLAACSRPAEETQAEPVPHAEPVVVYLDTPGAAPLQPVFDAFTDATGIPVTVREAPAEKNLEDVVDNTGAPPADVLLTANIHDIWYAGDAGALRYLGSMRNVAGVPGAYRDPDGQWFAIGADPLVIAYASAAAVPGALTYADLAEPAYSGQLCLSAAHLPENRVLIAHLIAEHERRPAERMVRRWLANLALPPRESTAALLAQLQSGNCRFAIVRLSDLAAIEEAPGYRLPTGAVAVSAYGLGLARHARYPQSGATLLDWLAAPAGQAAFASATRTTATDDELPAEWSTRSLAELGWLDEEARRLAERARWR
jgi:iron(III) transport system substrate-binding protein